MCKRRRVGERESLGGGFLEVGDEVLAFGGFLEAREDHLRPLNVLLRGFEVVEQRVRAPDDPRFFVCLLDNHESVVIVDAPCCMRSLRLGPIDVRRGRACSWVKASRNDVQVGALFMSATGFNRVALRTLGLEYLGTLCR